MAKYRKKPVVIEAFKFGTDEIPDWARTIDIEYDHRSKDDKTWVAKIRTLEGVMEASQGDFIIQGVNGEIYPCKPDIFGKTYEAV